MKYDITHVTTFDYSAPVSICHNVAHLAPRPCSHQKCFASSLVIDPQPAVLVRKGDSFGNPTTIFTVQERHERLVVTSHLEVSTAPRPQPMAENTPPWEEVRDSMRSLQDPERLDAYQFVFDSPYVPFETGLLEYARPSFSPGRPVLDAVLDLTRRIHSEFVYDPVATDLATPIAEVLETRRGVCQDFAHFAIGCLRAIGVPARYVSGYLRTIPPPGKPRLRGADASHAWFSVYVPGFGWVDIDPTNNTIPTTDHITIAWGRDFDDVSPIKGVVIGGGEQRVTVGVDVVSEAESLPASN